MAGYGLARTKAGANAGSWPRHLPLLAAVLFFAIVPACSEGGKRGDNKGRPAATVGTAKVVRADMPVTLSAIGTVQPLTVATVRTQLAGTLFSLHFTEGQVVSKGQLLARIDPRPYQLALLQAQGNLARDEALLKQARLDLGRYQTLLTQDSVASQQVDTQAALVRQYQGVVMADRAAVGTASLNLDYTSIRAPVSGRIGLRQSDIGNFLTPADSSGIAVITQIDPIDVSFALPQAQLGQIQPHGGAGMAVTILDQLGKTALAHGRFLTLDNQIDPTTGTVKAKARFANPNGGLFPSQFVNVSLLVDTLPQALTVPVSAVRHGAKGDFVFVLEPDKRVRLTPVTTGPSNLSVITILKGVEEGMTIVTSGADALDDGSAVQLPGNHGDAHTGGGTTGGSKGAGAGA